MAVFAEMAVETAKLWNLDLDYTAESLEAVDMLCQVVHQIHMNQPLPKVYLLSMANFYGAYLGEVLLRSGLKELDFAWTENEKGELGIGQEDFWIAPVSKMYKRITKGPEHGLMNFFEVMYGLVIGAVSLDDPRIIVHNNEETA